MSVGSAAAQQKYPDSLWVRLDDDSTTIARVNSRGQIEPAEWFVAGYGFQMYADSTCETDYHICAFKINDHRWRLRNWKKRRTVNADADILSFNSRTVDTVLHAGDVLSFTRSLDWRDPRSGLTDTNNYRSFDTLTYSVELVGTRDSVRLALIDSIGMMPRVTTGAPVIFGMRPIVALVDWTVPPALDGVQAFIRVRVRSHGSGDYYFTRTDDLRVTKWRQPPDALFLTYLKYLGQDYYAAKPVLPVTASKQSTVLTARAAGAPDQVMIDFATAPGSGATSVAIYDGDGQLLFYPYSSPSSTGDRREVGYRFDVSGVYLIALLYDNRIVATIPITIAK
ncbi:MAG TPA: hypothetical protein VHI13_13580 [Candidatus Kapabacteria bacterium]|nr:hypothetical protein [Candidatus Kapabacteria bacterium]